MIQGTTKTEAHYRAIIMDSSSSLKEFSTNRRKYHKRYILNEKVEEEDSKASVMGRLVETLLMEEHLFDKKFHMSIVTNAPTALMLDFVEALYKHTLAATDENGAISRTFEEIAIDAHKDSGFKIKLDAVLAKFIGSDAEVYYKEIREVRSKGLTVVTTDDVTQANRIVETLKTNDATAPIVNLVESDRFNIYNQLQIEGYTVLGHTFKSMMDKVVIDHKEKTIQVYDLKCTWSVENFYEEYYLYRRSYIQAYLYFEGAKQSFADLTDYTVLYPKFIVCDSTNYMRPLIYEMTDTSMDHAFSGFTHRGREYPGVKKIIKDLQWAIKNDTWDVSRENSIANSVVKIN